MNKESYIRAVTEFQLAIIKELYKNNKIGLKEYEYALNKLELKLDRNIVPNDIKLAVLDLKV